MIPQDVVNNYDSNKMFFVVAEFRTSGYFIGEFSTFEEAEMEHSGIVNLSMKYFYELYKFRAYLIGYQEYKINNDDYIRNVKLHTTNGSFCVYTLEINNTHHSIESFIKNRELQSTLFSIDELDELKEDFE